MPTFSSRLEQLEITPNTTAKSSLFQSYEKVIIETLFQSFGLDFLINDQHGGDVDTIHNVRQMDSDTQMKYKNSANEQSWSANGDYDTTKYHQSPLYRKEHARYEDLRDQGKLTDSYTGLNIPKGKDGNWNLDHVISAKEIHVDRGRVLSGLDGVELANSHENLKPTNEHLNKSMRDKNIPEYVEYLERREIDRNNRRAAINKKEHLSDQDKEKLAKLDCEEKNEYHDAKRMLKADAKARKEYERKINIAYYTSEKFMKDTALAAGNVGIRMGLRQATGLFFAELWFAVKHEFKSMTGEFEFKKFCKAIANGIKQGLINVQKNFGKLWERFKEGALAGVLSSIVTTLCNIFLTTAKNAVRIIRQSWTSLVQAFKILIFNPDNLPWGDRLLAVAKIVSTGASVIVGTVVSQQLNSIPGLSTIPVLGSIIPEFCGALVTGIISCTLLYVLDNSTWINGLVDFINKLTTSQLTLNLQIIEREIDNYAAKVMNIDVDKFRQVTKKFNELGVELSQIDSDQELSEILEKFIRRNNLSLPWEGDFDEFMMDSSNTLKF
jgi:hypothetical protein